MDISAPYYETKYYFILAAAFIVILYVARKVLHRRVSPFPRLGFTDMCDFKHLKIRSFGQMLDRLMIKAKKVGCKAAWLPSPEGLILSTWDADFVATVNSNPDLFPSLLRPRNENYKGLLVSSATMGSRDEWHAIMSLLKGINRQTWTPQNIRLPAERLLKSIYRSQKCHMDLFRIFQRAASQVAYALLFGEEPDPTFFDPGNKGAEFIDHLEAITAHEFSPQLVLKAFRWLPGFSKKELASRKGVDGAFEFIEQKRLEYDQMDKASISDKDFFPKLLDLCKHGKLPERGYLGETMVLLLAGQDTGSHTLVTACFFLAKHPQVQDALREELQVVFPDSPIPETSKALSELKLCRAVLDESLRLKPPATATLVHRCLKDTEIAGGFVVEQGTKVNLLMHAILRDKDNFSDPLRFHPNRWLTDDQQDLAKMKKAFRPFGFGTMACPGQALARVETTIFLASAVKNYRIKLWGCSRKISESQMIDPKGIFTGLPNNLFLTWNP